MTRARSSVSGDLRAELALGGRWRAEVDLSISERGAGVARQARVAEHPRRLPGQEKKEPHHECPARPQSSGDNRPTSTPARGRVGRPQTAQPHDGKSRNRSLWRPTRWRSVIDSSTQRRPRQSQQHHPGDGLLAMPGRSKSLEERRSGYVSYSNPVKSGEVPYHSEPSNRGSSVTP